MDLLTSLAVIALAALIHASFQLSVSMLTLLSGHSIGAKRSASRLFRLSTSFVFGAGLMTILLLSFAALVVQGVFGTLVPELVWTIVCGLMLGVAVSIWLFYYRKEKGTALWIPRPLADYLVGRTKSTKLSGEAFGLGLSSIIGEILFVIAPILISALAIVQLSPIWQLVGIALYTIVSMMSLLIVWVMIGSGHNLSQIQKWRESNKNFLQIAAGVGLVVLVLFIYVNQILESAL